MERKVLRLSLVFLLVLGLVMLSVILDPSYSVAKDNHKESKKKKQSFDKWSKNTGNGNVVKGSPYHKGPEVDIDGKKGDKVKAFRGGKVEYAGNKGAYGNTVIIKDKKGNREQYSHLDSINVKPGQKVKNNKKIGTIGTTGNVIKGKNGDGSHLHFQETDKSGKLIPPR